MLDAEDMAAWAVVAPAVRGWVAAAAPETVMAARYLLWAAARQAVWAYRVLGTLDTAVVWHPHNVIHFVAHAQQAQRRGWRYGARSALQRVGRAVNPDGRWPLVAPAVGRSSGAEPYSPADESLYAVAAAMPGRPHRAAVMWVDAGACGMGLSGPEIAAAGPADLVALSGDRIAVRVTGRNPRLVPARRFYTDMIRHAGEATPGDRFLAGSSRNAVHNIAKRLKVSDSSFSLRRARAAWLAAHLMAGTPLPALRVIAGPVAATTLDNVLDYVCVGVSAEDAAAAGLRA